MSEHGPVRQRLEYWLAKGTATVLAWLPWSVVHALGVGLGSLFYAFDRRHRRVALDNLSHAFPTRTPAERRAIARGVFRHFGSMLFEVLKFRSLSPAEMLARVEFEGADRARQAYAAGKGVFFLTGHFGCWEVHGIVHAVHLSPIGVMARRLDNPLLDALLEQLRQCTGNWVIYRRGGIRRTLRTLESGQGVAILIDQHIHGPDAIPVDFFDRPAATTTALAALAARTGAAVIPVFAIPLAPGRYRLVYEHAVDPPGAETPEAQREFTQRCTDVLEMYVRRYPELWLWMHRRWRVAPGQPEATAPSPAGEGSGVDAGVTP